MNKTVSWSALLSFLLGMVCISFSQHDELKALRSQLKYKFALDFVISHELAGDTSEPESQEPKILHSGDSLALEEFNCHWDYRVYKFFSFDGRHNYFLLGKYVPSFASLYLFTADSTDPTYLDEYNGSLIGSFQFDTLNGGNIIRTEIYTTGSGFYGHHLFFLAISNDKFIEQFHCYLEDLSAYNDTTRRDLGSVKLIDLNGDGYRDIRFESTEDMLDPNQDFNVWDEDELKSAKSLRNLSKSVKKFIWNPRTLVFEESR